METHLPVLSEGLLALEKDAGQPKRLEALMRAAHSIKGAARIVGLDDAVRVAHVMEDAFVAAQKGAIRLNSESIDALLRGVDALQRIGLSSDDGEITAESLDQLVTELGAVRDGRATAKPAAPPAPPPPARPATICPRGDLDAAEAEGVRRQLVDLLRQGAGRVRLDFAAVRDVDPAGLAALAQAGRAAEAALEIVNLSPSLRDLLHLTRLDGAFSLAGEGR
jgi:two-component system sensor histidine kinase and response regulator WspE